MIPNITWYDVILVNSSAGKDSQAMLDYVVGLADAAGVRDRVVVVHADLGRVEWTGTRALAETQARHYGARFESVARPQGDLLAHVEKRGMWPSNKQRYCTSDHKRGQIATVITRLVAERKQTHTRVLNCLGIRSEESAARAKKTPFTRDQRLTNSRRTVDTWYPIFDWTVDQVWSRIRTSGVPHHYAYDLGMPRLSCVFCVFAPTSALILAGTHNPDLLDQYVAVEQRIGHTFKHTLSLSAVRDAVRTGVAVTIDASDRACWQM